MNSGQSKTAAIQHFKRGTLFISKAHTAAAQGPYVVVFSLPTAVVGVSLDGNFSVNVEHEDVRPLSLSPEVFALIREKEDSF